MGAGGILWSIKGKGISILRPFVLLPLLSLTIISCSDVTHEIKTPLVPWPKEVNWQDGSCLRTSSIQLHRTDKRLESILTQFVREVDSIISMVGPNQTSGGIHLFCALETISLASDEGYLLDIKSDTITVKAGSPKGIFYGLTTLKQLLRANKGPGGTVTLPLGTIKDEPRFAWRGVLLDESRHFFGIGKVKQLLDLMAEHKLNKFHWHLTDEPAWRIEIKSYPKLTEIGSIGDWSNSSSEPQFYTQDQVGELVRYAEERGIEVIPEIDMPGHASAANRAYPEYSGGGNEEHPHFTFNPGKEATYAYLTKILKEVAVLFPSEYIHIGGDEVHFANTQWRNDPSILSLMQREKLKDLKAVEHYFLNRMSDSIKAMGKKLAGWDEIASARLDAASSMVFWWRQDKPRVLEDALTKGYPTVLCPRIPLYLDFVQHQSHVFGRRWGQLYNDIERSYHFPDSSNILFPDGSLIQGVQACIWTERIANNERLDYMVWPRLTAVSEAAWTHQSSKSFSGFLGRLKPYLTIYEERDIHCFNPFNPESTPEPFGNKGPFWQKNHNQANQ